MQFGFPISVLVHGGIIAFGILVLPKAMPDRFEHTPIIPVDLVILADETNIKAVAAKPEPVPKEQIDEALAAPAPAPLPPKPTPAPEIVVAPEPMPPAPSKEKAEIIPKPKPKPKSKPKPKPPTFDLARLDRKLAKQIASKTKESDESTEQVVQRNAAGAKTALSVDEVDLLRAKMYHCWRAPIDAPHPEELVIEVRFRLNIDGRLQGTPEVMDQEQITNSKNPYLQAAAREAKAAVIECQPYALPPEKYINWKETTLRFNAAEMMGLATQ